MKPERYIWNPAELLALLQTVNLRYESMYNRPMQADELNRWEIRRLHEAVSWRGENELIDDTTIFNTMDAIFTVTEQFRLVQGMSLVDDEPAVESDSAGEQCCLCECDDDEDSNFVCSRCSKKNELETKQYAYDHAMAVQGVLSAIDQMVDESQ